MSAAGEGAPLDICVHGRHSCISVHKLPWYCRLSQSLLFLEEKTHESCWVHAWQLAAQDSPPQAVRAERRISEESPPREHPRGTALAMYSAIHNSYCMIINRLQPRLYPGGPLELQSIQQKSLRLHSRRGRPEPKDSVNSLPSSRSSVIECCEDRSRGLAL